MRLFSALLAALLIGAGCGSKDDATADKPVEKIRENARNIIARDFKALDGAKELANQNQTKAALEAFDKESK